MSLARKADINQFMDRRQAGWRRLETLVRRVEAEGLQSLTPQEVREFGILYRRASSDLVTARAKTANAEILQYLNDLVARAYAQVYRSRRFRLQDLLTFLWIDFPRLFRHSWKYIALAAVLFLGSAAFGWEVNRRDPAGSYYMLPPEFVTQFPVLREQWSHRTGHDILPDEMAQQSSRIMLNNIAVGFASFAGGMLFGVGTLYVMVHNGLLLGILGQAMTAPGTALVFWSLILPHGVIELTAIWIMGGAGFIIGGALLAPGKRTRRDALVERGRVAVLLVLGAGAMLVLAGLIEGFITPPAFIPPWAKLAFAAVTGVGLVAYFAFAGRGPQPGLLRDVLAFDEPEERLPSV